MYLLTKFDVIVDVCDLMLQQKSPKAKDEPERRVEMGGSATAPFFGPLVRLLSRLIRCCHTEHVDPESYTFAKKSRTPEERKAKMKPVNLVK